MLEKVQDVVELLKAGAVHKETAESMIINIAKEYTYGPEGTLGNIMSDSKDIVDLWRSENYDVEDALMEIKGIVQGISSSKAEEDFMEDISKVRYVLVNKVAEGEDVEDILDGVQALREMYVED